MFLMYLLGFEILDLCSIWGGGSPSNRFVSGCRVQGSEITWTWDRAWGDWKRFISVSCIGVVL